RGSLSGRNIRLSLRIPVSLGNRETSKESSSSPFATLLQRHMRFPYLAGEGGERGGVIGTAAVATPLPDCIWRCNPTSPARGEVKRSAQWHRLNREAVRSYTVMPNSFAAVRPRMSAFSSSLSEVDEKMWSTGAICQG